jgi:hypothetical protein
VLALAAAAIAVAIAAAVAVEEEAIVEPVSCVILISFFFLVRSISLMMYYVLVVIY